MGSKGALAAVWAFALVGCASTRYSGSRELLPSAVAADAHDLDAADALLEMGAYMLALERYRHNFEGGAGRPSFVRSLSGLLAVQAKLGESFLVPPLVDRYYGSSYARLGSDELDRVNYLCAVTSIENGRLGDARGFLEAISPDSEYREAVISAVNMIEAIGVDHRPKQTEQTGILARLGVSSPAQQGARLLAAIGRDRQLVIQYVKDLATKDRLLAALASQEETVSLRMSIYGVPPGDLP